MTDDRREGQARLLADLEDAYGPAIRRVRAATGYTDVAVNEDGTVWATAGGCAAWTGEYLNQHAARRIVSIVADIDGQTVERAALSANLPTGERFAALLPPTVRGVVISIRLPPGRVFTLADYVEAGIMDRWQAGVLAQAVTDRRNILIVGSTGSGKTTLANALLAEAGFAASRVCIIQDQDELRCSGPNVVRAFTGAMDARDLVREFLRHSPDRIVIGEIRDGATALEWITASNTGHPGGLSTVHANSAAHGLTRIARLVGGVLVNVPHADIAEAVDLVAFVRKEPGGGRRLVEMVRPLSWDGGKFVVERL